MKINIIEVPTPPVKSFTMFAEPDRALLRETKTVRCSIHNVTKTRVSTDLQFGNYCVKINNKVEGFKLHEDTQMNYFSGRMTTSYYFVKSKKQNLEVYKQYLEQLVRIAMQYLHVELDELTVELECRNF